MRRGLILLVASIGFGGQAGAAHRFTPPPGRAERPAARSVGLSAPRVSVTHHRGLFNGQSISYTATVAEMFVAAPGADEPAATIITTSYVRDDVTDRVSRPVLFAFNGGPGASSSPLHLNALGPRRYVVDASGERVMGDNPFSPLDAVDLVFVDPVGTGFSRPLPKTDGQPFWTVTGDAASVVSAIEAWLGQNDRRSSPRYLCGESYGTTRAAQIVSAHPGLPFDGVLLLSMGGGPEDANLQAVALVPTFAAAASYHGVVPSNGRSPQRIFDEAWDFARGDYLRALERGDALPVGELERVARELSSRIGLPAEHLRESRLRVTREDFMLTLVKKRELRIGQLDARVTGALAQFAGKTPPYDDPSMPGASGPTRPTAHLYFTTELQFDGPGQYIPLNLEINGRWRFDHDRAMRDPVGLVAEAMHSQPRMRLFWIAGLYDLATPLASGRYLFERAGVPTDRVTTLAVPTGHMPYQGDEHLARFTDAVRRFTTAAR